MLTRSPRLPLWPTAFGTALPSGADVDTSRGEPVTREDDFGADSVRADSARAETARADTARAGQNVRAHDVAAAWFHEHVEALWRLVARLGVPAHSVEDVVQETFIVASRRRADIGAGHERRFLAATAVRLCSNYRQKAHVRRERGQGDGFEHEASPLPDAEQLLMEKRWRELLDRVLAELSDTHRTLFVLFELEGFSAPDIARLLDLPLGTVSSRLWRARARFSEVAATLQRSTKEDP